MIFNGRLATIQLDVKKIWCKLRIDESKYLYLIGAYVKIEVDEAHPLMDDV